ncbi:MAG: hypothetical protein WCS77_08150 [Elusimicrobiaceae bacterium]|jgi:hypothetical protein
MTVNGNEYFGLAIALKPAQHIRPEYGKLQAQQIAKCYSLLLGDLLGQPPSDAQLAGSEPLAAPADLSIQIG